MGLRGEMGQGGGLGGCAAKRGEGLHDDGGFGGSGGVLQREIWEQEVREICVWLKPKGGEPQGKGSLLQYSGLENSMDCIGHGVAKSRTQLSNFCVRVYTHTHTHTHTHTRM